jgi:hypothetical protein
MVAKGFALLKRAGMSRASTGSDSATDPRSTSNFACKRSAVASTMGHESPSEL